MLRSQFSAVESVVIALRYLWVSVRLSQSLVFIDNKPHNRLVGCVNSVIICAPNYYQSVLGGTDSPNNSEGDAWRSPKGDQCQMEWGMGRGVPSSADYGMWGSVVNTPSGVRPKTDLGVFWRPQNAPFCIYMTKIWGDNLHQRPILQFLGGLAPASPRDLRPSAQDRTTGGMLAKLMYETAHTSKK